VNPAHRSPKNKKTRPKKKKKKSKKENPAVVGTREGNPHGKKKTLLGKKKRKTQHIRRMSSGDSQEKSAREQETNREC